MQQWVRASNCRKKVRRGEVRRKKFCLKYKSYSKPCIIFPSRVTQHADCFRDIIVGQLRERGHRTPVGLLAYQYVPKLSSLYVFDDLDSGLAVRAMCAYSKVPDVSSGSRNTTTTLFIFSMPPWLLFVKYSNRVSKSPAMRDYNAQVRKLQNKATSLVETTQKMSQ